MSFKKVPYRKSYKKEMPYPTRGSMLLPNHGCGPRCQVDYNPKDDGPWTTLQIMRILDGDQVEPHTCAMPRYYAIPLILINKHLAFYEAQCHADGTPLVPSSSGSIRQRELREYNYLWRLRYRFLKEIFDMNHEPRLNERWRYVGIHGYLYRMYNRFGHDVHQRYAYWREEIKERRVPYTTPDVADMDWEAYIQEDMTTSTRINAFLWNRISQGYSRVVQDEPPMDGWRAWRAGHRDREPKLYRDPASSPVRELPSELGEVAAAVVEQSQARCEAGVRMAVAPAMVVAAVAASSSSSSSGIAAGSRCGVGVNETEQNTGHEVAALTEPSHSREWALPFPTPVQLLETSQVTITGGPGRLHPGRLTLNVEHNAPDDMEMGLVQCFFFPKEDVKKFGKDAPSHTVVILSPS
ncbi:hypothetical protein DFH94DRAFT_681832 [Russula ochroleuca]|uniref:Uncharacterized protein n=1 Tax=Russula ochroleuca TaxID=152965 RepID=A0A9P5MVL9_9AGAM|nr:hypothetical protein DFH94DRAFT_681832 [Russula ochroleuca]